jgi:hypothetical protein
MWHENRVEDILERARVNWALVLQQAGTHVPPEVERSLLVPAMRVAIQTALVGIDNSEY